MPLFPPASPPTPRVRYVPGRYYHGVSSTIVTGSAPGSLSARYHPVWIEEPITISALLTQLVTAESGMSVWFAVYAADPITGFPTGLPLAKTPALSASIASSLEGALDATPLLPRGLYWFGAHTDSATVAFRGYAASSTALMARLVGERLPGHVFTSGNANANYLRSVIDTAGVWKDLTAETFPTIVVDTAYAALAFKVA